MGGQWIREADGVVFNLLMVLNNKFTAVISRVSAALVIDSF